MLFVGNVLWSSKRRGKNSVDVASAETRLNDVAWFSWATKLVDQTYARDRNGLALDIDMAEAGRERKGKVVVFGTNRSKEATMVYTREEDSNYRSGTENAGFHQTLRGTILDKYSCFRIASMPPSLYSRYLILLVQVTWKIYWLRAAADRSSIPTKIEEKPRLSCPWIV